MANILSKIKKMYKKEMFSPSILGLIINPFWFVKRGLWCGIAANKSYLSGRLLDFGCGRKPYKELFDFKEYVGLDIEVSGHSHKDSSVDVYYDGKTIPFSNDYFDSVFSSEVFEHLFNLDQILEEIRRVVKPGGCLLITVPFVWDEHEIPFDFARYTSYGISHTLKKHGFEIVTLEKSSNYVETIFQMWNAYVYQFVFPKNKIIKAILTPLFIAPITLIGFIVGKVLPFNQNWYCSNIVIAKKLMLDRIETP